MLNGLMAALLGLALFALPIESTKSGSENLVLRLLCDESVVAANRPYMCSILVENRGDRLPLVIPQRLYPGHFEHRPDFLLALRAVSADGAEQELQITKSAAKGDGERPRATASDFTWLEPGEGKAWRYDFRAIWMLPTKPGRYTLYLRCQIETLDGPGGVLAEPALKQFLGSHFGERRALVASGRWDASITVTVLSPPA